MRRQLPTDAQVAAEMDRVLAESAKNGRHATIAAVERALDIPHATFDRNYRQLIDQFQQQARAQHLASAHTEPNRPRTDPEETLQRLRRDNEDLRRLLKIYAESIRQLTLNRDELHAALNASAKITTLPTRRD
ncbi:hypothetical protein [Streptosporangium roseum]|uniref:Uncharacterized protein n=1 Tax=Streptosporangium roseum (strain ATCC 12428 / DSM 43021 / JCM 3005 / KCTC 9067 / NCIMB 10171 / NRRL 2505 / NI 9100) TaxID=479432 RepID=D2AXP1_STRRD|nr:hypothetical protein [Streptosporangium roseum]ACZ83221.1 hypothetical protein Sros_0169 [Streptosporangium roseum DSM 43021]